MNPDIANAYPIKTSRTATAHYSISFEIMYLIDACLYYTILRF